MSMAKVSRKACLALGLALLGSACFGPGRDASRNGIRGGMLRVLSTEPIIGLDTAVNYTPNGLAMARAYARTLYSYDRSGSVPDIASGPPRLSADRRTYTFTLRPGVRYAPPVNREVTAQDFITAIQRLYDKTTLSDGQKYADLIAGARRFGAGKASSISGLAAPDARTLTITLAQPAGDFLSILTQPFFAPVPGEYAASYAVGANYDGHVVGSGPYTLDAYDPGRLVVLVRNPNWDPATDPLRKAWVDRIWIRLGGSVGAIQQAIEREEADLSLDSHVPQARVAALQADPERSRRLSVNTSECLLYPHSWLPPEGRRNRRCPGPPGGQLRHRQGWLPRRHQRAVQAGRRGGLHDPGPGRPRLPPLRPVPVAGWPRRPGQGQSPAGRGRLP
jgi:peptide/nickel transport system substrate-binding protein